MYQTLKDIVEGRVVEVPTYDFVTHSRFEGRILHLLPVFHRSNNSPRCRLCMTNRVCVSRLEDRITVYPADVVLFEGILVFYTQKVRDMFHMKLFVDTDSDVRLSRRGMDVSLVCNILFVATAY